MIGVRLGHYEILEKLGSGGMGEVYKALDTSLRRIVAVKVLPADKVADPVRKQRFIQEARAASALNHPNIVVIHDIANESGTDFLVMEYVPGRTLQQTIPRKGLELSDALRYAVQIADALAAAHAAGIVHRDLKPSNIMVTEQGRVKVLDFGLAKLIEEAGTGSEVPTRTAQMHTDPGTVVGSAAYMSPEQAEGKAVDLRSDIFSFGAVLYEMITGRMAFHGDSRASIMAAVLKEQPKPARDFVEVLPHELDHLVSRCLRKDVSRRSQSMAEIKLQLEDLKQESDAGTLAVASPPRSKRAFWFVTPVLIVLGVAAGTWILTARRDAAPPFHALRQVTHNEGVSTYPALSPDGKLLAYASDRAGENNLDIWVQHVAGGDAIRLTRHRADDSWPRFSPDGSQIAFMRQGDGIYLISSLGGPERLLAKGGFMPAYSPDGKWIAYYTGYYGSRELWELFVVSSTAGAPRKLETGLAAVCCPIWSPDGKHLLVEGSSSDLGVDQGDWFIVPAEKGRAVKIDRGALRQAGLSYVSSPVAWLGARLIFGAGQGGTFALRPTPDGARHGGTQNIWQVSIEPGSRKFQGKPQRLTAGSGEYPGPASLDGRIPFSTESGTMTIYALPMDIRRGRANGELVQIVHGNARSAQPSLSADGRKMVFTSDRAGTNDIWIKDLTTGEETLSIGTADDERRGLISPDGSQMAFQRFAGNIPRNYMWPLPAGPEREICEGCTAMLNWTADGKSVIIGEGEPDRMLALDVATGQKTLVASHPKYAIHDGSLSPDRRWIVFKLVMSSSAQPVFIAPVGSGSAVPEAEWVRITGDYFNQKPFWSPDGAFVYYYSLQDNFHCLYARRVDVATKQPQGDAFAVQHFHGALRPSFVIGYGIAPDRVYIPMVSSKSDIWLAQPDKTH